MLSGAYVIGIEILPSYNTDSTSHRCEYRMRCNQIYRSPRIAPFRVMVVFASADASRDFRASQDSSRATAYHDGEDIRLARFGSFKR